MHAERSVPCPAIHRSVDTVHTLLTYQNPRHVPVRASMPLWFAGQTLRRAFVSALRKYEIGLVETVRAMVPPPDTLYVNRAIQCEVNGGQFDFVCSSARPPRGACV